MVILQGEETAFEMTVLGRHIPEGFNSWENNWLEAEFAVENNRFATRRLTVHDIYDLYFHLGIALEGLSPTGVLVPLIQRQLKFKLVSEHNGFLANIEMTGLPDTNYVVSRSAVVAFAEGLHQLLLAYPLRADEVPSVAPVIEFYSTKEKPDRLTLGKGMWAVVRSWFKVSNPIGRGRGDAIRFTFTLSKPSSRVSQAAITDFFLARDYRVEERSNGLKAVRGSTAPWNTCDGKGLPTEVQFVAADTHSIVTYDVWTAGFKQSSRRLFAWVGEAAMFEVFLAGYKELDQVGERLSIMDSNLRRARLHDLLRLAAVLVGLTVILVLAL